MRNLYKVYKTNTEFETNGVKLDFGGPAFFVRRAGGANRKFAAAFSERTRPHARALKLGTLGEDLSDQILIDVYFDAVVTGWENIVDETGQPMEFNKANFKKLMTDLPELWEQVRVEAQQVKNFQDTEAREDGEALGN